MRFYPALLFAALILAAAGCQSKGSDAKGTDGTPGKPALTALKTDDTKVGTGPKVESGDDVWVNYKGELPSGSVFDTNMKPNGDAFHVTVGQGMVIKGWDAGLVGMQAGGKRRLSIPYMMAYGEAGKPPTIPPKTDLYFDVEMVRILKKEDQKTLTVKDVKIGTGAEAQIGSTVRIDYELYAGNEEFEDSKTVQKPTVFKIGDDKMQIQDFDKCLVGMKVGGVREIMIPPMLARELHSEKIGQNMVRAEVTLVSVNK